jgi:hypothetical protein
VVSSCLEPAAARGSSSSTGTGDSILPANSSKQKWLYTVKYVLDGNVEEDVAEVFIRPYVELERSSRRTSRGDSTTDAITPAASTSSRATDTDAHSTTTSEQSANAEKPSGARTVAAVCGEKRKLLSDRSGDDLTSAPATAVKLPKHSSTAAKTPATACSTVTVSSSSSTIRKPAYPIKNTTCGSIVMLSTSLDPSLQSKLQLLSELCEDTTVTNTFTEDVTHLVVSVDKQGVLPQRTMKYLKALICKILFDSSLLCCVVLCCADLCCVVWCVTMIRCDIYEQVVAGWCRWSGLLTV